MFGHFLTRLNWFKKLFNQYKKCRTVFYFFEWKIIVLTQKNAKPLGKNNLSLIKQIVVSRVLDKESLPWKESDLINQILNIYDPVEEKKIIKGFSDRSHSSMPN
jgi:hypothetical protein